MTIKKNDLQIAICQLNFPTSDIEGNYHKIAKYIENNCHNCDLIIFPELALTGYDCQDLFFRDNFIKKCEDKIISLVKQSKNHDCYVIIGAPYLIIDNNNNRKLHNAAFIFYKGEIKDIISKKNLPNNSVFDEKRYFHPGDRLKNTIIKGNNLGLIICEDLWGKEHAFLLSQMSLDAIIVINASPFHQEKKYQRLEAAKLANKKTSKPIIYLNQIGGQDEIVFDGSSFIINSKGDLVVQLKSFSEDNITFNLAQIEQGSPIKIANNKLKDSYQACVLGLRDYITKIGFSKVIIGMSGGIDSALVAVMAVDSFGTDNVNLFALPSKFNSQKSYKDALECSKNLNIKLELVNIEKIFGQFKNSLEPIFNGLNEDVTEENLQSRIRGNILMAIANKFNKLLIATGNKSEMAVGYSTIYGDMCGAYNPVKDLYKTEIYQLAQWRNENIPEIANYKKIDLIPQSIIKKQPTAELRANQKDSDYLPEYDIMDKILYNMIEDGKSMEEIIKKGFEAKIVERVFKLVKTSEFKRSQAPKGVIISRNSL